MRHLQFQHHDGDDDSDDTIAECFESTFAHPAIPSGYCALIALRSLVGFQKTGINDGTWPVFTDADLPTILWHLARHHNHLSLRAANIDFPKLEAPCGVRRILAFVPREQLIIIARIGFREVVK
jgi:hypothetical protein